MDEKTLDITLTLQQIVYLTHLLNKKPTLISPLSFFDLNINQDFDKIGISSELVEKGILLSSDKLSENTYEMLIDLANSTAFVKVTTQGSVPLLDCAVYFGKDKQIAIFQETREDTLRIIYPVEKENMIDMFSEYIGKGDVASYDLVNSSSNAQLLTFAGLVDIRRKQLLHAILNNYEFSPELINENLILSTIQSNEENLQWFTPVLKNILQVESELSASQIKDVLSEMEGTHVTKEKDGFMTLGSVDITAGRFLIFENIISIENACLNNDVIDHSGFDIIRSGLSDLLLIEQQTSDSGRMLAITQNGLIRLYSALVDNPESLKTSPLISDKEASKTNCPKCKSEISESVKFCPECGESLKKEVKETEEAKKKEEVAKCAECGASRVKPEDKFCRKCGAKYA